MRQVTVESTIIVRTKSPTSAVSPPVAYTPTPISRSSASNSSVPFDDSGDYFAGNQQFIASDSWRNEDIVYSAYTKKVVDIHNQCVLCNTFPHRQIACFFPVHISKGRFGSGAVGVHDVAIFRVPTSISGIILQNAFGKIPLSMFLMALCTSSFDALTPRIMYRWLLMS